MRRFLAGGLLGASVLSGWSLALALLPWRAAPGGPSLIFSFLGNLLSSMLAVWLILQAGPRSIVERAGLVLTAAAMGWSMGLGRAAFWDVMIGWGLAGAALAIYLHPRQP